MVSLDKRFPHPAAFQVAAAVRIAAEALEATVYETMEEYRECRQAFAIVLQLAAEETEYAR